MEPLLAIDSLRRVRGGSQAHVILADNNRQYVCKMKKNPQSDLVLVNELLATRLARHIGLCVPTPELILATDTFFDHNPSVKFELGSRSYQPGTGLQFGSELIVGYKTYDYVPSEYPRHRMASLRDFHGILAFDKWTCQVDGRQLLFNQSRRGAKLKFVFMDFGYAFHQDWEFHDRPFGGVYPQNYVYEGVSGWDSFEPWLSAIEGISPAVLSSIADDVPEEWLTDRSRDDLNRLCERHKKVLSELQHSQQKRETCDQRTPANLYAKDESHMRTHSTQQRCFRGLTSDGTSNVSKSSSRPIRAERRCVLTQKLKVQLFEAIRQCDLEIIECIAHQKDPAQRKLAILGEMDQREERMTLAEDWNFRYPSCPIALCC